MEIHLEVLQWLAILPVILAAFRAISIGDRLYSSTVTGRHGGETSAQTSLLMAGLSILAILLGIGGLGSPQADSIGLALITLAFGGFLLSHYMLQGFRSRQWQGFVAAAIQEASFYWLMLGIIRTLFANIQQGQQETEFITAGWIVVVTVSVALIIGTFSRMSSR